MVLIDDSKNCDLSIFISARTGAGQVRTAEQREAELKKNPKETAVICNSYKERNSEKFGSLNLLNQISLLVNYREFNQQI